MTRALVRLVLVLLAADAVRESLLASSAGALIAWLGVAAGALMAAIGGGR